MSEDQDYGTLQAAHASTLDLSTGQFFNCTVEVTVLYDTLPIWLRIINIVYV